VEDKERTAVLTPARMSVSAVNVANVSWRDCRKKPTKNETICSIRVP
jgi:hypothetical protein